MLKFIQRQLDINLIKSALAFALIYFLLFNTSVLIYKFNYYNAEPLKAILELAKQSVYTYIALFVFFFGLMIHRSVFVVGSLFLFITGAIASYYVFVLGITPSVRLMPAIFETNYDEAMAFINPQIVFWIVFAVFVCLCSIKHFNIQTTKIFITRILSAFCLFLTVNTIMTVKSKDLKTYFPLQYLNGVYVYFHGQFSDSTQEELSKKFKFELANKDEDILGVLVIGESARYDRFGINGYHRDTTPNLNKMKNLTSFRARSCSNVTHESVPCMLSRYSEADFNLIETETSLVSVLTDLGFNTVWLGTQSLAKHYRNFSISLYDEPKITMIPGGTVLYSFQSYDGVMLPTIEKQANDVGKNFLVIHTIGSHWNYRTRYPDEFLKYPTTHTNFHSSFVNQASCDPEDLNNSYDNTILYTDFFLSNVIELLKNKKAFLIYASDHSESIGECGRYGHSFEGDAPEQREVPFMMWVSDSLKQEHPHFSEAIESHKGNDISHDYLFHTIMNCLGIESEIVDSSLSLCSLKK